MQGDLGAPELSGDQLVQVLSTLANPHRMRVIAALRGRRVHVSRLARELGISRPLLQVHLRRLEMAGLTSATLELSEEGKAMKFYEVTPFEVRLTPDVVARAAQTLTPGEADQPVDRAGGSTRSRP